MIRKAVQNTTQSDPILTAVISRQITIDTMSQILSALADKVTQLSNIFQQIISEQASMSSVKLSKKVCR